MIWGALKNRIALDPAASLDDLGDKIGEGLAAITKQEWIGHIRKSSDKRPPTLKKHKLQPLIRLLRQHAKG
ncbi:hypothetical protein JG688_00012528 [Phytophthora aleatoria]|uniref:Uncharacterized protein n=1 Tax=Phytophthora aleatoria TaxID=2496075 RepID=A0A8J5IAQ8_9STRA|nr:hypothetical protein JG688_00012528 [Phytophthora aleatoria]